MTTNEIIRDLCRNNGVTIQRLEQILGFSNASIAKANSNMKAEKLKAIADYFHVSMEYLMTGKDPEPDAHPVYPGLSPDAVELARSYMMLSPELKNAVRRTAGLDDLDEDEEKKKEA